MKLPGMWAHGAWLVDPGCTKPLTVANDHTPPATAVAVVPGVSRELADGPTS